LWYWTWLVASPDGSLSVETTQNGDTPLMEGRLPILGRDLWEHAYYRQYRNSRLDYILA
jgi:Fe-Mn family superoxide dismutase